MGRIRRGVKSSSGPWGYSQRKKQAYPKGSTTRATSGHGSSMSGIHRRRGQDRLLSSEKNQVRKEAAKDLAVKGVTMASPVARTVKDGYDIANDIEKIRTGENKSLIDKVRER
jgi:hypothetical protein